jgi:hypothetical protein
MSSVAWKHWGVRLTEESWTAWDRLFARKGVTQPGLFEALGELLADGDDGWLPQKAVERARQIDRQRHSRR